MYTARQIRVATNLATYPSARTPFRLLKAQAIADVRNERPRSQRMWLILTSSSVRHATALTLTASLFSTLFAFEWSGLYGSVPALLAFIGTMVALWYNRRSAREDRQLNRADNNQLHLSQTADKLADLTDKERARLGEWAEDLYDRQKETIAQQAQLLEQQKQTIELQRQQAELALLNTKTVTTQNAILSKLNATQAQGMARLTVAHPFRVLMVDDNEDVRLMLEIAFAHAPFIAEFAADGHEALSLYYKSIAAGTPYKLLVLDFSMPQLNGLEVTRQIRESGDLSTKIVMLTAYPGAVSGGEQAELNILHVWSRHEVIDSLAEMIVKVALTEKPEKKP